MSRFWEIVFYVPLLFRRHVCLSKLKHSPSRESPLTAHKTVFSHLNHRFPGVTTGLTFKVFDLWSITISSKPNAFHGLRLDIVASNTSVAESFLKPSPSLRLLPSDLNFLLVTNFPFKRSWWDTLPSLTGGLKEGWKEMFFTTWKGLQNFFHSC